MKDTSSLILNIIITFVITLALQTIASYSTLSNGEVQYSVLTKSKNDYQAIVRIENASTKPISDLQILIPKSVHPKEIISTNPIKIDITDSDLTNQDLKILSISMIPPSTTTILFIPLHQEAECCTFVNLDSLQLNQNNGLYLEQPLLTAFKKGIEVALILMLIYIPITLYLSTKIKETSIKLDSTRQESADLKKTIEDLQDEIKKEHHDMRDHFQKQKKEHQEKLTQATLKISKIKATLIRAISDYSKELDFWKDTIRKMLYTHASDSKIVDKLIDSMTATLGTYQTKSRLANDAEATLHLANQLKIDTDTSRKE